MYLRGELSDGDDSQNHGNTRSKEDVLHPAGEVEDFSAGERGTAQVDCKVDEDNHELTSHEVTVQVVSLVSKGADLVGGRVRFLVKFTVNRGKTDHGALPSFNHGHPDDTGPHHDDGKGGVNIGGDLGAFLELQGSDNHDGEDDETH